MKLSFLNAQGCERTPDCCPLVNSSTVRALVTSFKHGVIVGPICAAGGSYHGMFERGKRHGHGSLRSEPGRTEVNGASIQRLSNLPIALQHAAPHCVALHRAALHRAPTALHCALPRTTAPHHAAQHHAAPQLGVMSSHSLLHHSCAAQI